MIIATKNKLIFVKKDDILIITIDPIIELEFGTKRSLYIHIFRQLEEICIAFFSIESNVINESNKIM